jgi:hypothetical protein
MPTDLLIRILNASVAPVIVISGIGLLLLSMTNRIGRVIDRSRVLAKELETNGNTPRDAMLREQLAILRRRGRLLRGAILLCSSTVLLVCIAVLSLFASQILGLEKDWVTPPLFAGAMLLVIPGVYLFIRDITVTLEALDLEVGPRLD